MAEDIERRNKRQAAYNLEHYKRVELIMSEEEKIAIKNHAEDRGETICAFIRRACAEQIKRDNE